MFHFIIENEDAYNYCRKDDFAKDDITWHAISSWLLEKLPRLGEKIISLEKNVSIQDHRNVGYISIDIADKLALYLDSICKLFSNGIFIGRVFK